MFVDASSGERREGYLIAFRDLLVGLAGKRATLKFGSMSISLGYSHRLVPEIRDEHISCNRVVDEAQCRVDAKLACLIKLDQKGICRKKKQPVTCSCVDSVMSENLFDRGLRI